MTNKSKTIHFLYESRRFSEKRDSFFRSRHCPIWPTKRALIMAVTSFETLGMLSLQTLYSSRNIGYIYDCADDNGYNAILLIRPLAHVRTRRDRKSRYQTRRFQSLNVGRNLP